MVPHEPYWRTNSSFSPPLSRSWNCRFQSEGLLHSSPHGIQLYGSSVSSDSRQSRSWVTGNNFSDHQYAASDGSGLSFSSPSESFQTQHWTTPPMQGDNTDDFELATREQASGPLDFTPYMEGPSAIPYSGSSTSSRSDGSDYEHPVAKSHVPSYRSISGRCSFMSKPIYPLSFPSQAPGRESCGITASGNSSSQSVANESSSSLPYDPKSIQCLAERHSVSSFTEFGGPTLQREALRWSSASSSVDFTDVPEQLDCVSVGRPHNLSEGFKCELCERFLSHRSPWSSRRIVRSGDMPVAGVLSCCHVFHAECLEQTTPKAHKHDPPCPLCARSEETIPEQQVVSRLRNGLPRLRPFCEDESSRPWGCGQVGDCVEGALCGPPRNNSMLSLNRSRLKKHLFLKGNSSKELSDRLKRSGLYSSQLLNIKPVDQDAVGCSKTAVSVVKR